MKEQMKEPKALAGFEPAILGGGWAWHLCVKGICVSVVSRVNKQKI